MENNEDNRQMTVLHELYKAIDSIAFSSIDQGVHDVVGKEHVKSLIESLLPKERNIMEDCFSIGQVKGFRASQGDKPIEPSEYFNETFKPYEK